MISGLSGSGKTQIAKNIERDFKIEMIDCEMYCKKDYDNVKQLHDGTKLVDWDDIDSFDWKAINKLVNNKKSKGVVISGPYFVTDLLGFDQDFHVHIKIQKQMLIEARKQYVENNKDKCENLIGLEAPIVNQITYPHYLDYLKKSKIDKFVTFVDVDKVYDETTDFLFFKIQAYLNEYNKTKSNTSSSSSDEEIFLGTQYGY